VVELHRLPDWFKGDEAHAQSRSCRLHVKMVLATVAIVLVACSTVTGELVVDLSGAGGAVSYGATIDGNVFLASQRLEAFVGGSWHGVQPTGSRVVTDSGSDAMGMFHSASMELVVEDVGTRVVVAVRSYPSQNAAVFSVSYPDGANGTNPAKPGYNAQPSFNFPSFATDAAKLPSLGCVRATPPFVHTATLCIHV
jgi:hypothetical protein